MGFEAILHRVGEYYSAKIHEYGAIPRGVDWNSAESQMMRFEQLAKVFGNSADFSVNDYGCGYGALIEYLAMRGFNFTYSGFDVSTAMIDKARELHQDFERCNFFADRRLLSLADYTVASGVFNVKLQASDEEWYEYMRCSLDELAALSAKGFGFNALSLYSDVDRRRADLHYADPLFWFDYCKREFSRFVALLHDYPLYEFTILVRY